MLVCAEGPRYNIYKRTQLTDLRRSWQSFSKAEQHGARGASSQSCTQDSLDLAGGIRMIAPRFRWWRKAHYNRIAEVVLKSVISLERVEFGAGIVCHDIEKIDLSGCSAISKKRQKHSVGRAAFRFRILPQSLAEGSRAVCGKR